MDKDTVTGAAGAVLLVLAMAGIFAYEYQNAEAAMQEDLALTTIPGPSAADETEVGRSTTKLMAFDVPRMTNVSFTLSWAAASGSDTLQISVRLPGAETVMASSQEDDGTLTFTVPVPGGLDSPEQGVGTWEVEVMFVEATPPAGNLPVIGNNPVDPPQADSQVAWNLTTSIEHYAPVAAE